MKKTILYLLLLISSISFGQTPSVYFQDTSSITIQGGPYIYIQDGLTSAIQSTGNSGFYIPDSLKGYIYWNTGSNSGNYQIPFISSSKIAVPVKVNIATTSSSGTIKVSNIDAYFPSYKNINSINRDWIVDFSGYSSLPSGTITLNWLSTDYPSGWGNFVLEYYNGNWIQNTSAVVSSSVATFPINSFVTNKEWTIFNTIGVLPITLLNFEVHSINNSYIKSLWITASEINNRGFIIEKSLDASNWDSIGWVNGSGNSSQLISYSYDDHNVSPNTIYYYRLKQIDFDGNFSYSNIQSGEIASDVVSVSNFLPNPSTSLTKLIVNTIAPKTIYLKIYDVVGREIGSQTLITTQSKNIITINTDQLSAATYNIVVIIDDISYTRRLIVQK